MRKKPGLILAFCSLLFLLSSINTSAQVYNGDIKLTTQAEVDAFNYTSVTGWLEINETVTGSITNLNGLLKLTSVGGQLNIEHNFGLENLEGLSSLTSVGLALVISENYGLTSLDGLYYLTSVGGLLIQFNPDLTDIDVLSNLTSLTSLGINENDALTNLDALSGINSVSGGVQIYGNDLLTNINGLINLGSIGGNLSISLNNTLTNIDGLSGLGSVGGSVILSSNQSLTNIDPLSNLSSIDGLTIHNNDALTYLPFDNLTTIEGDLIIQDNDALPNLDGLASLISIEKTLKISDNDVLVNIIGLSSVNSIGDSLIISKNNSLLGIDVFSSVPSLGGDLKIDNNASLTNMSELDNLSSIGGNLSIVNNPSLPHIHLSNLISLGGGLTVSNNSALTNLDGLLSLPSVPGNLAIENNGSLVNIDGLSSVTNVGGNLNIYGNNKLANINGLNGLTSVGGSFSILLNPALVNLNGLLNLTSVASILEISDNDALPDIEGLSNLSSVEYLYIQDNNALSYIGALTNLKSLKYLVINNNNALADIGGLSNLTSVEFLLAIQNNAFLKNLNGLSGLISVLNLFIQNNDALINIDGLSKLTTAGGDLTVTDNALLSQFCGLYTLLNSNGLSGTYTVSGNAVNPTRQQIIDNGPCCSVTTTTFYRDADGDGYGNPSITTQGCAAPIGYVSNSTDCDDTRALIHPGAEELCNNLDDDCDGQVDEDCTRDIKVNIYGGSNPYSNPEWNNWNTTASLSFNNLRYSDGTVSSVRVALSQQTGISDNGIGYNTTMTPPEVSRYGSYSTVNRTVTISGLDNTKTYNLEIYATRKGVSNNTSRFTIGSTSFNILTDNNLTNKASFYSLVPSSGTIIISLEKLNTYSYINGFILTTTGSTPPPPPPPSTRFVKVNVFGGVNPYNNSEWNNWNSAASLSSGNLRYSDGIISSISASFNQQSGISDNGVPYNTTMAPSEVMRYASYSTVNRVLTISGLDNSKTYNLEIYASRKGVTNNTTRFTIGSIAMDVVTDNNLVNKVSFTNLTPSSGQIIINIARLNAFNYVNGFILTENSAMTMSEMTTKIADAIPIPSTVNIFPNPVNDRIVLQINNKYTGKIKVQVIDMSGITIKQFTLIKNHAELAENLQIGNLRSGNYIIRIEAGNWIEYKKVSKL